MNQPSIDPGIVREVQVTCGETDVAGNDRIDLHLVASDQCITRNRSFDSQLGAGNPQIAADAPTRTS